jgi:hypothetical protein
VRQLDKPVDELHGGQGIMHDGCACRMQHCGRGDCGWRKAHPGAAFQWPHSLHAGQ